MNRKGFTVIELVAIIVVLAAIFLVSFPSIINTAKKNEEKKFDMMVKNLCMAGESYIKAKADEFPALSTVGSTINIAVNDLISYGNVKSNIKNPKTDASVSGDSLEYKVLPDQSLECEYRDN